MNAIARWHQTWSHLDASPPEGLLEELLAAYAEPHRAYHTVDHLTECFAHLDGSPVRPVAAAPLELALWFHDAIYDTKASDSEARSAAWARSALGFLAGEALDRIEQLILVTQHSASPTDADQELLLDVDLSILGAPSERFDEYETQVRQEYEWVPEEAYRTARSRILTQFQERPRLYHTKHFRDRLESRARQNLRRSLGNLAG